jgi:ribonuclease J
LGQAGLIAITLVLDGKGRAAADPAILLEGIPEPVHEVVRLAVEDLVRRHKRGDADELAESVRRAARRAAHDAWGKKPVTRVTVVEI